MVIGRVLFITFFDEHGFEAESIKTSYIMIVGRGTMYMHCLAAVLGAQTLARPNRYCTDTRTDGR
jgi:hypothetical protein